MDLLGDVTGGTGRGEPLLDEKHVNGSQIEVEGLAHRYRAHTNIVRILAGQVDRTTAYAVSVA